MRRLNLRYADPDDLNDQEYETFTDVHFDAGADAYLDDYRLDQNPNPAGSIAADFWEEGWTFARDEDRNETYS